MDSIKDVLKKFNPLEDKYISREFQSYAIYLSEKMNDLAHKSLYMRLAKTLPRPVLEEALRYVVDSKIDNKGALFMWKLKEMGVWGGGSTKLQKTKNSKYVMRKKVENPKLF